MNCIFSLVNGATADYRCQACGLVVHDAQLPITAHCATSPDPPVMPELFMRRDTGPGSELKEILMLLGITEFSGCGCDYRALLMNAWGVAECRKRFEEILSWLQESYDRLKWSAKLKCAVRAVGAGIALAVDPSDPARSILTLAIDRAAEKELDRPAISSVAEPAPTAGDQNTGSSSL